MGRRTGGVGLLTVLLLALPRPSWAGLGGGVDSVAGDAVAMKGQLTRRDPSALYSLHEITTSSHTVVREYVSSAGVVFGVAWEGPVAPDLERVMGVHFAHLSSVLKERQNQPGPAPLGRQPLSLRDGELVFETRGHGLSRWGRAFVTSLIPAGISSEVVQ